MAGGAPATQIAGAPLFTKDFSQGSDRLGVARLAQARRVTAGHGKVFMSVLLEVFM